uniref:Uncharacterized protein n=1 Tax=Ralstonia solanacearum TaxID=305 RepID=A0A0S4VBD1_RALSL|nr:protein of unknown function [Ralstonia solanacearum]CUV31743.1 protein of unknown function [Ralstonia solanacearum]
MDERCLPILARYSVSDARMSCACPDLRRIATLKIPLALPTCSIEAAWAISASDGFKDRQTTAAILPEMRLLQRMHLCALRNGSAMTPPGRDVSLFEAAETGRSK